MADWSNGQGYAVRHGTFLRCVCSRRVLVEGIMPCALSQSTLHPSPCRAACGCDQTWCKAAGSMAPERVCGGRGLRLTQGGSPGYQRLADEDPQLRNDPAAQ